MGVTLSQLDDARFRASPWPFAADVTRACESRRLTERFDTEAALHAALDAAPADALSFELRA